MLEEVEQAQRLLVFARAVRGLASFFALIYLAVGLWLHDPMLLGMGLVATLVTACAHCARSCAGRGRVEAGARVLGYALFLTGPAGVLFQPTLFPPLAVVPVLAVAALMPHVSPNTTRRFLVLSLLDALLVLVLGSLSERPSGLPVVLEHLLLALTLAAACSLAVLLFWQYGTRLEDAARRSQAIIAALEEGIVVQDGQGRLRLANGAAERLLGPELARAEGGLLLEPERFGTLREDGQPLPRSLHPGVVACATGQPLLNQVVGLPRPGAAPTWLSLSAHPLGEGGVVYSFSDVSRRRADEQERSALLERERSARAQAEEASRAKDEFLATVSHELRTPLTAILGWARLVRTGRLNPEQHLRALEVIERNAHAQAQLVEDILDVSRVITGKLRLDLGQADLRMVVEGAADALRLAAEARSIELQLEVEPGLGPVPGDAVRLQQVVWNLLSNAIKFTSPGGRVAVRAARLGNLVRLSVQDTGQGIESSFLPHVFERFRQADSRASRTHGGLGLGLAIVRHLVELHGGTVRAESPGLGQGSTFVVELPVPSAESALMRPLRATPPRSLVPLELAPRLEGVRVLVLDDQADARELLRTALQQFGAVVLCAESASEALDAVGRWGPHIILSDIAMPEESGYRFLERLRDRGVGTPAIALTAYAQAHDRTAALRAGFSEHLAKPLDPLALAGAVEKLLKTH